MVNGPLSFQNKGAPFWSDTGSSDLPVSSTKKDSPVIHECSIEENPQIFKVATVEENKLGFERAIDVVDTLGHNDVVTEGVLTMLWLVMFLTLILP